jgi:hypothetical protein
MSLPYSYTNSVLIFGDDYIDENQVIDRLRDFFSTQAEVKDILTEDDKIEFTYKSFLGIPYNIEMHIIYGKMPGIEYEIKLNRLIQVCIALVIFVAFFSSFGLTGFLWFSAILTVVFYALNVTIIDKLMRDLIAKALKFKTTNRLKEETLSEEQKKWIQDKSKCPACGEDITEYDRNCPECGLRIREKAPTSPFDVSKYPDRRIKYEFKPRKK